ncbi:MAG: LAGLIDADG family homing endonuclease [Minisyncoccia bacterium]
MAESCIDKRAFFPKGEQLKFLNNVQQKLLVNNSALAEIIGKNVRTLADWKREKSSMSFESAKFLSKKSGVMICEEVKVKEAHWYTSLGASAGGNAVYKKYGRVGGNEEERKRRWRKWWETKGQFEKHPILFIKKPIKKPGFSAGLAEFVGILLGDGGIAKRQVVITLHRYDDKEYREYVRLLVEKLFDVVPGVYKNKESLADNIVISRTELVHFCVEKLGLKAGNKVRQQVDVPVWIKDKKSYHIACLRGLVDTDGCVIKHCYTVKGKRYSYKKLSFTNVSVPLLKFVFEVLGNLGMNPRTTKNGKEVRLESQADMGSYFRLIGSNNPKHLNRWLN